MKLPVPDGPFPSGNVTLEFNEKIAKGRNMMYEPALRNCMKQMRALRAEWSGDGCIGKAFLEKERGLIGDNEDCPFCGGTH